MLQHLPIPLRILLLGLSGHALAPAQTPVDARQEEDPNPVAKVVRKVQQGVRAYEPNQVGMTKDESDDWFMDFTLSVMLPLTPPDADGWLVRGLPGWRWHPFSAMTFRAGQYLTRDSAPVVGKRFNPTLLGARFLHAQSNHAKELPDGFVEVVYAHESNGQSIADKTTFDNFKTTHEGVRGGPAMAYRIARDNISRGWDYFGLNALWFPDRAQKWCLQFNARVFMSESVPQGEKEEYKEWEDVPGERPRHNYDGLTVRVERAFWKRWRASAAFTTGLKHTFAHPTFRGELSRGIGNNWRLIAWMRQGYNSDLVDYYQKDSSWGLAVSLWEPRLTSNPEENLNRGR